MSIVPEVKAAMVDLTAGGTRTEIRSGIAPMSPTRNESGSDEQRHATRLVSGVGSCATAA